MLQIVIALFALVLLFLFLGSLMKHYRANKGVDAANDELQSIKNENKILDVKEKVATAKAKLQARKDADNSSTSN